MKFTNWKDLAELLGISAIVASLIFVGLQLKQESKVAQLEMFDRSMERQLELADWITQHADVWQRGCLGEELTSAESVVFAQIHHQYVTHNYIRWLRFKVSDFAGADDKYIPDAFAANQHRYPGIGNVTADRRNWTAEGRRYSDRYLAEYLDLVAARLEELKVADPTPDWDVKFCGI